MDIKTFKRLYAEVRQAQSSLKNFPVKVISSENGGLYEWYACKKDVLAALTTYQNMLIEDFARWLPTTKEEMKKRKISYRTLTNLTNKYPELLKNDYVAKALSLLAAEVNAA